MRDDFRREYLCEWVDDPKFELFVKAWTAYYEAADQVDGHLHPLDRRLVGPATAAGYRAMDEVLPNRPTCGTDNELWREAQSEARRRMGT